VWGRTSRLEPMSSKDTCMRGLLRKPRFLREQAEMTSRVNHVLIEACPRNPSKWRVAAS
jgi:hypothetical protein